jgi:hypothetical protein
MAAAPRRPPREYPRHSRRMLLDMHIPDWEERFLRRFDPAALADRYEVAGATGVMMYCKSQVGLTNWPSRVGRQHPGLGGRDAVGELLAELRERGIAVCAFTSIAIDREAAVTHPDWQVVPARVVDGVPEMSKTPRHSALCLNRPEYLAYEKKLLDELLGGYDFDACFLDMMFWSCVCVCSACRGRYDEEVGGELPERVDWADRRWAAFAAARERWAEEFSQALLAHARSRAAIPVYENFAAAFRGWAWAKSPSSYRNDSFLGGDLYGGRHEQLLACKLMLALSPGRPPEYTTSCAPTLADHVSIKPEPVLERQVLAATALSCATMLIDAVDHDGTVQDELYEQVGRMYRRRAAFEPELGGEHLEDVGVYFSGDALVRLLDDGAALAELALVTTRYPHCEAAIGAVRALQEMHLAAGIATERQLDRLDRYAALVLPDLTRVGEREIDAFETYVCGGGRLYASGRTGLLGVDGTPEVRERAEALFGVRFEGDQDGPGFFLRPLERRIAAAIAPQRHLLWSAGPEATVPPRISPLPGTESLAALTLPYAYPAPGTRLDRHWASSYSSPPWRDSASPLLVERELGAGRVVFSALPLETGDPTAVRLLRALLAELVGERVRLRAEAPPTTWVEAFDQPRRSRMLVSVLDYPADPDDRAVEAEVMLRPPEGTVATGATALGERPSPLETRELGDGALAFRVSAQPLAVVALEYRDERPRGAGVTT